MGCLLVSHMFSIINSIHQIWKTFFCIILFACYIFHQFLFLFLVTFCFNTFPLIDNIFGFLKINLRATVVYFYIIIRKSKATALSSKESIGSQKRQMCTVIALVVNSHAKVTLGWQKHSKIPEILRLCQSSHFQTYLIMHPLYKMFSACTIYLYVNIYILYLLNYITRCCTKVS